MQIDRLSKKLEGISDASKKGRHVRDLFRIMTNCRELWLEAYANIYSNKGAITEGVDANTLDGFSEERVERIIEKLKDKKYKFRPVRRTYIPKRNKKKRPLGIPAGDDKLVQEAARILLERVYEPVFSDHSHGFRPERSCHTALKAIQREWKGVKWFIEFDIKGFFDNLDHEIMVRLLEKKIDDKRFIKLIGGMLKAGYLEECRFHQTYSGCPQGGIVSPILSNIYLHELDSYMDSFAEEFQSGKRRKANPEYKTITSRKLRVRRRIDQYGKTAELMSKFRELDNLQRHLPSMDYHDGGYKRLRYQRYADDFVAGVIGTRADALDIMSKVKAFIEGKLGLSLADDKTGISAGKSGMDFLGYRIRIRRTDKTLRMRVNGVPTRKRTVTDVLRLEVPDGKAQEFCQRYGYGNWQTMKPIHRKRLLTASEAEIILTYNSELRGLANYYALADDYRSKLHKLEYLSNYSLCKTLAGKHKISMSRVISGLRKGNELIHKYEVHYPATFWRKLGIPM